MTDDEEEDVGPSTPEDIAFIAQVREEDRRNNELVRPSTGFTYVMIGSEDQTPYSKVLELSVSVRNGTMTKTEAGRHSFFGHHPYK